MKINSEGNIVLAFNMAQELISRIQAYLLAKKLHANGINGISIPNKPYCIILDSIYEEEGVKRIKFGLTYTETFVTQTPQYYEPEDDNFQEGYGSDLNVYGYTSTSHSQNCDIYITIPFRYLLATEEELNNMVKASKVEYDKRIKEEKRLAEIAKLSKQLEKLRN